MENVGIFYGQLVYFTAIWIILGPFGLFYCHLVYFTAIWYILLPFGIFCGYFFKLPGPGWGANPGSFYFVYFLIPTLNC
jgi:hypothetical protein